MKRTTLTHFLMAGLAICLITACTKEENEYDLQAQKNIPLSQVNY